MLQHARKDDLRRRTSRTATTEGNWSWGTGNESISPLNGNPGAFLQDLTLNTCCPAASTQFGDSSEFTGNYRLQDVQSVGIDLITLDASSGVGGRPLSVILIDDNGTPQDFDDDSGAFFIGSVNIPDPGVPALTPAGWTSFDFDIPSGSPTLPARLADLRRDGVGASDAVWNQVIVGVDVLQFFYGNPVGIFPFLSWDVGLDNPRIEKSSLGVIAAQMDVRPGACPNPFNPAGRGVLDVVLVGDQALDASQVDPSSLLLSRSDGVGGGVQPNAGPPGPGSVLVDVAAPSGGQACDCGPGGGTDGILDLLLHFRSDELEAALLLDAAMGGTSIPLTLTGALLDGTPFIASDCALLVPVGGAIGLVHHEHVSDFHQTGLVGLDGVAPTRVHHHHGGIGRTDDVGLHLTHPHGLHHNPIATHGRQHHQGVTGGTGQPTEVTPGGHGPYVHTVIACDVAHAHAVAQDGAAAERAGRIDGQYGHGPPTAAQFPAQGGGQRALPRARRPGDADGHRGRALSGQLERYLQHLGRCGPSALHQAEASGQGPAIAVLRGGHERLVGSIHHGQRGGVRRITAKRRCHPGRPGSRPLRPPVPRASPRAPDP